MEPLYELWFSELDMATLSIPTFYSLDFDMRIACSDVLKCTLDLDNGYSFLEI